MSRDNDTGTEMDMKKVRITVLKTTLDEELAKEYGTDGLSPCPIHKAGEVYYADYAKPEGFCDEAWKQYTNMRSHSRTARRTDCSTTATG